MRLAVGLAFGLILAVEVIAYSTFHHIAAAPRELYGTAYAVQTALSDLRADLNVVRSELSDLAEAPSPVRLHAFQRRVAAAEARMTDGLQIVAAGLPGDLAGLEAAQVALAAWRPIKAEIVAAVAAGDTSTAFTLAKTVGATQMREVSMALDALAGAADPLWADLAGTTESLRALAAAQLGAVILLTMLCLALVLRFMARTLVSPTAEIGRAIKRVAEGHLSVEIPHTARGDEIGEIARSAQVFLEHAVAIRNSHLDVLTGLPTRDHLHDQMRILRLDPEKKHKPTAVLHFDVDGFGELNDTFGRPAGDAVLQHLAKVMRSALRPGDFLARDGADSFAVLLVGWSHVEEVATFACTLCERVMDPLILEPRDITITCSAGIALCDQVTPPEEMLAHAENALIEGRKLGPGTVTVYTDEMDARLRRRRETVRGLKFGLGHDEVVPFFQPQINAITGELIGFEALVRWQNPELGVLSPWQFMDVAAEAGLLRHVTDNMIAKTTRQLAEWRRQGLDVPRVSLNIAASDLTRSDFTDELLLHLERSGLNPEDICVELLETAMIEDTASPVGHVLNRLGALGFPIELDDFGTGHAAISTLQMIKLSGIKIDRSFITKLHERPDQLHLTRGILRISKALQIETIAEGVESHHERALLVELGCDIIQGFGIAPPMSAPDATEWLVEYRPAQIDEPVLRAG